MFTRVCESSNERNVCHVRLKDGHHLGELIAGHGQLTRLPARETHQKTSEMRDKLESKTLLLEFKDNN